MNEIKVLEVHRTNGSRLWLFRRHGAVLRLAMNVLGMPYHVHVVETVCSDKSVAELMARIPNNRPAPLRPKPLRKSQKKVTSNHPKTVHGETARA